MLLVLGIMLPSLFDTLIPGHSNFFFSRQMCILYSVVAFSPIAYFKSIKYFAFSSFITQFSMIAIVILIVLRGIARYPGSYIEQPASGAFEIINKNVLSTLGGYAFIFVCHDLSFSIFEAIEKP